MSRAESLLNELVDLALSGEEFDGLYQSLSVEIQCLERLNERWCEVTGYIHPGQYEEYEGKKPYKDSVVLVSEPSLVDKEAFTRGVQAAKEVEYTAVPGGRHQPVLETTDGHFGRLLEQRMLDWFGKDK